MGAVPTMLSGEQLLQACTDGKLRAVQACLEPTALMEAMQSRAEALLSREDSTPSDH